MRQAVYAGTFDPITKGHLWVIEQGVALFDELVVAVAINPDKQTMFTLAERIEMVKASVPPLGNVRFATIENRYLVDYAKECGIGWMLRGVRNEADATYEKTLRNINAERDASIQTVYVMPPLKLCDVSSSLVKGLVGPAGWEDLVGKYVPDPVLDKLKERNAA
jgi:pantetheine-phosphate adenylyltransferase